MATRSERVTKVKYPGVYTYETQAGEKYTTFDIERMARQLRKKPVRHQVA
jgi:hypothetical protein